MNNQLSPFKLILYTIATIAVTFFNLAFVIFEDPPGFFGYLFGIITGANIIALLAIFIKFLEDYP